MTIDRIEAPAQGSYRKDPNEEDFLKRFNSILDSHHKEEIQELPEVFPTLHVIGAPRSGTTLMTQLLATCLDVGYINNLIATFWSAPLYGIRLSKKLIDQKQTSDYTARYGRTEDITEPHEFGYFWSNLLQYRDMAQKSDAEAQQINWPHVAKLLTNINHEFGKPTIYKSFLLGWHIQHVQRVLPKTLFIYMKRDALQNGISIYEMRKSMFGSPDVWNGLIPQEYKDLKSKPAAEQIAGQVHYVNLALEKQISNANPGTVHEVSYQNLCENPTEEISKIVKFVKHNGCEISQTAAPPDGFPVQQKNTNSKSIYQEIANATIKLSERTHE